MIPPLVPPLVPTAPPPEMEEEAIEFKVSRREFLLLWYAAGWTPTKELKQIRKDGKLIATFTAGEIQNLIYKMDIVAEELCQEVDR